METMIQENTHTAKQKPQTNSPNQKKKWVRIAIAVLALAAAIYGGSRFFQAGEPTEEVITAYAENGSIIGTVSGEGLTRAKESSALSLTAGGVVQEVLVQEGDWVEAGQMLYRVSSETAETALNDAKRQMESCQKEYQKLLEAKQYLELTAPYKGKLISVQIPQVGDSISNGYIIATLVDDSTMKLSQYFSYAYAQEMQVGQTATISLPQMMTQVTGTVSAIYMVERISNEGTKLFEVEFTIPNPGTLTDGMTASATLSNGTITPYEAGTLTYQRTTDLFAKVSGVVEEVNLRQYAVVQAGELLVRISGDGNDTALFQMENQLKTAKKTLEEAQHAIDLLQGISPIAGTVMSIGAEQGDTVEAGTVMAVVSDSSELLLDISIDERNISSVQTGMTVEIDQWGTTSLGTVSSVSLTSKAENGIARFPAVVSIDNTNGTLLSGSYASYHMITSQSNDCICLPIQAIKYVETEEGTQTVVFVHSKEEPENTVSLLMPLEEIPENDYWPVPVSLGISDNQNVEILEGIALGTEVYQQRLQVYDMDW